MSRPTITSLGHAATLLAGSALALALASCSVDSRERQSAGTLQRTIVQDEPSADAEISPSKEPEIPAPVKPEPEVIESSKLVADSGAGIQVKSVALLKRSIASCMGEDMTVIRDDMLLAPDIGTTLPPPDDYRIRFLDPTKYPVGKDILDVESPNLFDPSVGPRTSAPSDSLTATYLQSLEVVANVVAHNCSLDNDNCRCAGKEQAAELLSRCLPRFDPADEQMQFAAEYMGLLCTDDIRDVRKVVASLISSYAFAIGR